MDAREFLAHVRGMTALAAEIITPDMTEDRKEAIVSARISLQTDWAPKMAAAIQSTLATHRPLRAVAGLHGKVCNVCTTPYPCQTVADMADDLGVEER